MGLKQAPPFVKRVSFPHLLADGLIYGATGRVIDPQTLLLMSPALLMGLRRRRSRGPARRPVKT